MSYTVNPTDKERDEDLERSDAVMVFHNSKSRKHFFELLGRVIDREKNEIVYIYEYTKDKTYTVGIKARD